MQWNKKIIESHIKARRTFIEIFSKEVDGDAFLKWLEEQGISPDETD